MWIRKKSGGAATSLLVHGNELVDDVKTRILERYPTSLLLKCDPADLVLTVQTHAGIRLELQPDEYIVKVIDKYFPKGMRMNDAVEVGPPVANWGLYDKPTYGSTSRSTSRSSIRGSRGQLAQQPTPVAVNAPPFMPTPSQTNLLAAVTQASGSSIPTGPLSSATATPSTLTPFPPANVHTSKSPSPTDRSPVDMRRVSPPSARQTLVRHDSNASSQGGSMRRRKQSNTSVLLLPRQLATGSSAVPAPSPSIDAVTAPSTKTSNDSPGDLQSAVRSQLGKSHGSREMLMSPLLASDGFDYKAPLAVQLHDRAVQDAEEPRKDVNSSLFELQQRVSPSIQISQEGRAIIVPQIKVLIVEDNPINQRLLEAFMKRKKVRYGVAKNGREALEMWKSGEYHLIFMDIQLPVMTGLEATKEIRRLEVVNGIGVSHTYKRPSSIPPEDVIMKSDGGFRSPVIIVALTASNDQDDKSDALAAGCNDFLTKPVSFSWLEKKIIEWGCMQALIDFDGWKTWNDAKTEDNHGLALNTQSAPAVETTT